MDETSSILKEADYTEIRIDNTLFTYNEQIRLTGQYQLHCHNFYEIYYCVSGNIDYLVEGKQYAPTPGSLLLLAPGVFHGVRIRDNKTAYRRFSFHFYEELLPIEYRKLLLSIFPKDTDKDSHIYLENLSGSTIDACFKMLLSLQDVQDSLRQLLLPVYTQSLLSQIMILLSDQGQGNAAANTPEVILRMIPYLNDHITEPLPLDELSARFYISKHHLNKIFRKATGTTVGDYILHKRVNLAQQLLYTGKSSQEACSTSGFTDYSSFYRAYRKIIGRSPIEDRGRQNPGSDPKEFDLKAAILRE